MKRLAAFAAGLEKEVRGKKYGLVFEEHRERVDVELDENLPVLTEVEERFISRRGAEGENGEECCQCENIADFQIQCRQ